ncbi:hypothetical protein SAMN04488074_12084 [Lentzea albidocapillata subsp. violacea]|uniref:Pentapeptide repeat-containing protein n=1 Tax=Lentzea albidocapillata subsp. violacea TaxID=128104 RepID=A0A1G9SJF1_9PSEU|nr:hypothetical protein [Lentzea albidocapillata]SDM35616.1 hypothetical protein SAMN04488074_12084 [Lentzea albidocapillata subsp. violacea]
MEPWLTGIGGALALLTGTGIWIHWSRHQNRGFNKLATLATSLDALAATLLTTRWLIATTSQAAELRIIGSVAIACVLASISLWTLWGARSDKKSEMFALPAAFFTALTALLAVMLWLRMTEVTINRSEALKAGGLASGAIVALYALWLNDRRRKVEESRRDTEEERRIIEHKRQEVESAKAEHDRERVANEHFARAVELLGNDADQVRVGALHALSHLATTRSEYRQTVADIICAYLRRPMPTASHLLAPAEAEKQRGQISRERHVRATAERLLGQLTKESKSADTYLDLDLTDAVLQEFTLEECLIGGLIANGATFEKPASFLDSTFKSPVYLNGCKFENDLSISTCLFEHVLLMINTTIAKSLAISSVTFEWPTTLSHTQVGKSIRMHNVQFSRTLDLMLNSPVPDIEMTACSVSGGENPSVHPPDGYYAEVDSETGEITIYRP